MEELIEYLQDNPSIKEVWFSENMSWTLSERPRFEVKKTREEILSNDQDEVKTISKKTKNN